MNEFITFRDKDKKGNLQYYVCGREYPHFVGRIGMTPEKVVVDAIPMTGYKLFMIFCGTLSGNRIPALDKIDEQITSSLMKMSAWYYENRILVDEKRYKKFKINVTNSL